MTVLTSVLEKLRGKRQDQAKSVWQQYNELVTALATDQQADVDELALCLDQLDKSEADLSVDVERKQKRLAAARRLEQFREIDALLPGLEKKHEAAISAYNEACERLRPAIADAFSALESARLSAIQFASAENELLNTVDDPEIIDAQASLDRTRTELGDEMRELSDRVHDGKIALNHARSMVESCEYTIAKIKRGEEIEYEKGKSAQELQKARTALEQVMERHAAPVARHNEIERSLRALTTEQAELNKRKLIP